MISPNLLRFNLNLPKYEEIILSLLKIAGGRINGKKKMAKLLYFYEFDFFEKYEKTSTGETFLKYEMGPFPANMEKVIDKLCANKKIKIITQKSSNGYKDTVQYELSNTIETSLTQEENLILKRIEKIYLNKTGKELEDISHLQAPWNAVEMYQVINLELSYYRDTEF